MRRKILCRSTLYSVQSADIRFRWKYWWLILYTLYHTDRSKELSIQTIRELKCYCKQCNRYQVDYFVWLNLKIIRELSRIFPSADNRRLLWKFSLGSKSTKCCGTAVKVHVNCTARLLAFPLHCDLASILVNFINILCAPATYSLQH